MKSIKHIYWAMMGVLALTVACEKTPELTVLDEVEFDTDVTTSSDAIVLAESDTLNDVITFSWSAADYQREVPVNYTLQFTTADDKDTWSRTIEVEVGEQLLTATMTGRSFNDLITDQLGITPGSATEIAVRVKSYVDRAAYSNYSLLEVTGYKETLYFPSLYIVGDYQGWDVDAADLIVSKKKNDIYEGYVYVPDGSGLEFLIYEEQDANATTYGMVDGTTLSASSTHFSIAEAGYYLIAVNLNTMEYLAIKTTWGLIGGATPGGWNSDTEMTYDEVKQVWTVTTDLTSGQSFKFRANKAWQIDFGVDENQELIYANHPWLTYIDQPQLAVGTSGQYTVELDLHDPTEYTYSIISQ